jgi:nitric oxide dioxygenase
MVNLVIMRLDRLDQLTEDIRQLAIRHVEYGTKPEHYKLVGTALLWTLERGLGNDWTPELKTAWTECYTELANTMIEAAYTKSEIK